MTALQLLVLVAYSAGCWRFLSAISYGLIVCADRWVWWLHDHDVKDHAGCCPSKVTAHV